MSDASSRVAQKVRFGTRDGTGSLAVGDGGLSVSTNFRLRLTNHAGPDKATFQDFAEEDQGSLSRDTPGCIPSSEGRHGGGFQTASTPNRTSAADVPIPNPLQAQPVTVKPVTNGRSLAGPSGRIRAVKRAWRVDSL